jgi:hypothetical protein
VGLTRRRVTGRIASAARESGEAHRGTCASRCWRPGCLPGCSYPQHRGHRRGSRCGATETPGPSSASRRRRATPSGGQAAPRPGRRRSCREVSGRRPGSLSVGLDEGPTRSKVEIAVPHWLHGSAAATVIGQIGTAAGRDVRRRSRPGTGGASARTPLQYDLVALRLPEPMLLRSGRLPSSGDFAYEPKWDGSRCLVSRNGRLRAVSRRLVNDTQPPRRRGALGESLRVGPRGRRRQETQRPLPPRPPRLDQDEKPRLLAISARSSGGPDPRRLIRSSTRRRLSSSSSSVWPARSSQRLRARLSRR